MVVAAVLKMNYKLTVDLLGFIIIPLTQSRTHI